MKLRLKFLNVLFFTFVLFSYNTYSQCSAKISYNGVVQQLNATILKCAVADSFEISFNDSTGSVSRTWKLNGKVKSNSTNPKIYFNEGKLADSIFKLTLISQCTQGIDSTSIFVKVLRKPRFTITSSKDTACQLTDNVSFSVSSTKTLATYVWDINKESFPTTSNPQVQFLQDGFKYVTLTATDNDGCGNSITFDSLVYIVPLPNPVFSINKNSGCIPLAITFTNTTLDQDIVSWLWEFGDNSTSNLRNLSSAHTYNTAGTNIKAKLTAINAAGCSNSTDQTITAVFTPTAVFTTPSNICQNYTQIITYTGSSNNTTKYTWSFGNTSHVISGSDSGPLTVLWDSAGSTNITLTTKDEVTNCSNTSTKIINVKAIPKIKLLSTANGKPVCASTNVLFSAEPSNFDLYTFKLNGVIVKQSASSQYSTTTLKNNDKVSLEIDNGCGDIVKDSIVVQIKSKPTVSLTSSDNDDKVYKKTPVTFIANPSGFETYDFFIGTQLVLSSTSNTYTTDSLGNNKSVSVIAYDQGCKSDSSNKVVTTVLNKFPIPVISAQTFTNKIILNWNKVLNELKENPIGYQISINGNGFVDPSTGFSANGTSHLVSGLNPGDSITVQIKAIAGVGLDTLGNSLVSKVYKFYAILCDPVTFVKGDDQLICAGDTAYLSLYNLSGLTGNKYSIKWGNNAINRNSNFNYIPSESEVLTVTIVDSTQIKCLFETSFQVEVKPLPMVNLDINPKSGLIQGNLVTFNVTPTTSDLYVFFKGPFQVQSSASAEYSTRKLKSGDIVYAKAYLDGCVSLASNNYVLNLSNQIGTPNIIIDSSSSNSVSVKWDPVDGATGYLISVNGQTYVIPNGGLNQTGVISHLISGLTQDEQVSIVVKAFNDTDTIQTSPFVTSASGCREISFELSSNSPVCESDMAKVMVSTSLNYLNYTYNKGSSTSQKEFDFVQGNKDSLITVKAFDISKSSCYLTKNITVPKKSSQNCQSSLQTVNIILDSTNINGLQISWKNVDNADSYILVVNGKEKVISSSSVDINNLIKHSITDLNNGDLVSIVVKTISGKDTISTDPISTVYTNGNCRKITSNLAYDELVCANKTTTVSIINELEPYVSVSWQGNSFGTSRSFSFAPSTATTVTLKLRDNENPNCYIVKSVNIAVDYSVHCIDYNGENKVDVNNQILFSNGLDTAIVGIDTTTSSSVVFSWKPIAGASGYMVSYNGSNFTNYNTSLIPNSKGFIVYSATNLVQGQTVSLQVKSFTDKDTTTSLLVYGTALSNCSSLNYDIAFNDEICAGDSAKLTILTAMPAEYLVYWNNNKTKNVRNYSEKINASKLFSVVVINPLYPNCELKKNVTVNVNTNNSVVLTSSAIKDSIFEGQSITFKASPSTFDNYEFLQNSTSVQNGTNIIFTTSTIANNSKVKVFATSGNCQVASNEITIKVKKVLTSPNLFVTSNDSTINISWNQVDNAVKYQISINGGEFQDVNSGSTGKDTTHTLTNLTPDSSFTFVIKAVSNDPNGFGSSTSLPWYQKAVTCNAVSFKVSNDTTICSGKTTKLKILIPNTSTKYSFRWANGPVTSARSYDLKPTKSTTVAVQLIDSAQVISDTNFVCPYYRYIKVNVNETPQITNFTIDTSLSGCNGSVLNLGVIPSSYNYYYFETKDTTFKSSSNSYFFELNNYKNKDSVLIYAEKNGCISSNTFRYNFKIDTLPAISVLTDLDSIACQSQSANFFANYRKIGTYNFYENDLLVKSSVDSFYVKSNLLVGKINPVSVSFKDKITGCSISSDSGLGVNVRAYSSVSLKSSSTDNQFCKEETIKFTATPSNLIKYKFFNNNVLIQDSTINFLTLNNLSNNDSISVLGINTSNCESPESKAVKVKINPIVKPTISADTVKLCKSVSASIVATVPSGSSSVVSFSESGGNTSQADTVYTFKKVFTNQYTKVYVNSNLNGCVSKDSIIVNMDLETLPVAKITVKSLNKSDTAIVVKVCEEESQTLLGSGSKYGKYNWYNQSNIEIGNLDEYMFNLDNTIASDSVFNIYLKATNVACSSTAKATIKVLSCSETAQIITPNGDGKNDVWVALNANDASDEGYKSNTLVILNRWGNEVYSTKNYDNTWDGKNNSGVRLPEGTYFYLLKVSGESDKVGYIVIKY